MKETFSDIGKRLPYCETEEYIDSLIHRATEGAIRQQPDHNRSHKLMKAWSAAAVVLILIGIGALMMTHTTHTVQADGPLDEFLNSLSNEELTQLNYYEIEEIPEY